MQAFNSSYFEQDTSLTTDNIEKKTLSESSMLAWYNNAT